MILRKKNSIPCTPFSLSESLIVEIKKFDSFQSDIKQDNVDTFQSKELEIVSQPIKKKIRKHHTQYSCTKDKSKKKYRRTSNNMPNSIPNLKDETIIIPQFKVFAMWYDVWSPLETVRNY
jgi:hypothetical protein